MRRVPFIVAALLTLWLAPPAAAQTGRAIGRVVDADGKPVMGAIVRATNSEAYPPQITSSSDSKGRFAMIGLRSGPWTFVAEAPGFQNSQGVMPVRAGAPADLRFVLQRTPEVIPGALSKDIEQQIASAGALRNEGRYDQAISAYQSIQAKNPKLTALNLVLADVFRKKAEREQDDAARRALYDRAIASYAEVLKGEGDHASARYELGMTYLTAGDTAAAAKAFQEVVARSPGSLAATSAAAHLNDLKP